MSINDLLVKIPLSLKSIVKEAEFINKRRWDIILKNDIKIKLPELKIKAAFEDFIELYDTLSNQDKSTIESIDLRLPKKAIIQFNEKMTL